MALSSAAELVTAIALVLAAAQLSAAAEAPPAPIGLPNCNTTCGNISVPYPFGIHPGCYRPGFNLTCDTSHGSTRLLLGDGTLRVVDIMIQNATVRVHRDGSMVDGADNITSKGLNVTFAPSFAGGHYRVSYSNELVLFGCQVLATLVAGPIVLGCSSFCSSGNSFGMPPNHYCTNEGCCQASFSRYDWNYRPTELHLRPADSRNNSDDNSHVSVFLAEVGWLDQWGSETNIQIKDEPTNDIPLLLRWDIMQGLELPDSEKKHIPDQALGVLGLEGCPGGIASLCRSNNSRCTYDIEVYMCECNEGYYGNPYVAGGCQDINECDDPQSNGCFGDCTNTEGSFECRCTSGTFGDATIRDGCFKINPATGVADAGMAPARIGLTECETTCGDVRVPYPFGFGPSRCNLPGFDLTCDASHNPPRLLLGSGNSTLQIVGIFLNDSTVRVIHAGTFNITNGEPFFPGDVKLQVGVRFPDIGGPYTRSGRNEFILAGCNIEATLHGEYGNTSGTDSIISRCISTCTSSTIGNAGNEFCFGRDGCCHAHIPSGSRPKEVKFKQLRNQNMTQEDFLPPLAFVAEEGKIDQWYTIFNKSSAYFLGGNEERAYSNASTVRRFTASQVPLVLRWVLKQNISTSPQSDCRSENGGYTCHCRNGYYGNPYIIDGCEDIDECKDLRIRNACFGDCINLPGSHECRCPRETRGDPYQLGGCVKSITGLTIGLLAATGPALLLLVLGVTLALREVKQRRIKLLKQKYFKQNRGQLLQQLVSQWADIGERMIIPVDELAKATNNFDQARELGGGGHGTVYKGILSDQNVVAIKKSKIAVQKEIDEFINEVAILSQVNHRNVVKLLGCCLETEVPLLVYEFISNGTLYHHLHVEGPVSLSWANRLRIATEISHALAYLHSSVSVPIIHRDIKSSNILLDDTLTSKVSDFGASRYIPVDKTALTTIVQGTIGYLDPMCFCTGRLNEKSDVYSFGVILVELLTRKKPFSYPSPDGNGLVMHFAKLHAEGNLAEILDPQIKEEGGKEVEEVAMLASLCIKLSSDDRPMMREVEHTLQGIQASKKHTKGGMVTEEFQEKGDILMNFPLTGETQSTVSET